MSSESKVKSIDDLTKEWAEAQYKVGSARSRLEHAQRELPYREREYHAAVEAEQDAWRALSLARDGAVAS